MQLSFKQVTRQTRLLNHSMAQAFTLMRMNKVELLGHLSEMMGENPFLEADRGTFDFPTTRSRGSSAEHYDTMVDTRGSLYSHIADQLPLIFETDHAHRIALAFLSEIEPSGWLGVTVAQLAETYDLPLETCAAVLTRLQTVEPAGLFARDLKECLRLQAIDRRLLDEVMGKVIDNLDALMGCDVLTLASRLKANPADVVRCLDNIRRMDPKPGTAFEADETLLRESDVTVAIIGTDLAIELNSSSFPTVRLSDAFQTSAYDSLQPHRIR